MEKGGGGRTIRGKKEAEQVQTDDTVRLSWTEERGCGKSHRKKMKNDVGNGKKQFTCSMKRLLGCLGPAVRAILTFSSSLLYPWLWRHSFHSGGGTSPS